MTLPRVPRRGVSVLLFLSSVSLSNWASAQVNVEPLREELAERGFGARLRASLASYAGNTRGLILGSSALVGFQGNKSMVYTALSGDYAKLNSQVSVAKWFAHARYNYRLLERLWWEAYAQAESDRFRRVASREVVGSGPRFEVAGLESLGIYYGASYMLEHTNLSSADPSERGEGLVHRFSHYGSVVLRAHDRILLSSVTYVQPRFDEPSDFSILSVNGAEFMVMPVLVSRIDAVLRYDSVVPFDVRHSDLELKSSLELRF